MKFESNLCFIKILWSWFEDDIDANNISNYDLIRYLRLSEKSTNFVDKKRIINKVPTIISSLKCSKEEIFNKISKTYKYDIRKSINDNIEYHFYLNDDITEEILASFYQTYSQFCKKINNKEVRNALKKNKIKKWKKEKCLCISCAKYELGIVYHVYVYDANKACLVFSASDFRNEGVDKNIAGRANKALHYKDMCMFKDNSIKIYDWGNISSIDHLNGIDVFKKSFGGEICYVYNEIIATSLLGNLILSILKFTKIL